MRVILEPTGNLTSAHGKHDFSVPFVLLGETNGAAREAFLMEETFPFETAYTVQKSGAPLDTVLGTSALNFLYNKTIGVKRICSH